MQAYLEFERPIAELEGKIVELRKLAEQDPTMDIEDDVARLQGKAQQLINDTYGRLTPWQKALVARHPAGPHFSDYAGRRPAVRRGSRRGGGSRALSRAGGGRRGP